MSECVCRFCFSWGAGPGPQVRQVHPSFSSSVLILGRKIRKICECNRIVLPVPSRLAQTLCFWKNHVSIIELFYSSTPKVGTACASLCLCQKASNRYKQVLRPGIFRAHVSPNTRGLIGSEHRQLGPSSSSVFGPTPKPFCLQCPRTTPVRPYCDNCGGWCGVI